MAKNIFNSIQLTRPKNNVFDLSHDVKLSCNMGELVPVMCTECVPGDRFNIGGEAMIRFAPMVAPVMHRFDVTIHYFFVPNRIIWAQWEQFITNSTKVNSDPVPAAPWCEVSASGAGAEVQYNRLLDYLGIPTPIGSNKEKISILAIAAYYQIWYDYYRDQNMQQTDIYPARDLISPGQNPDGDIFQLKKRAWEHDYFTSALPFAQQGDPVSLPLGSVELNADWGALPGSPHFKEENGTLADLGTVQQGAADIYITGNATDKIAYDPAGSLEVQPTTINDLRRAFRLQEWLEKAARGGARYIESILTHFGVRSSDKRLDRAEYITGVKTPVMISEVLNTTGTADAAQGEMAGHGVAVANGKFGNFFCEEHGYIMGIMSVMPKTAYQQGIPKHFLKYNDAFDYYWPSFANIGEQEVLNKEVYAFQGSNGEDTFGYVPRYAEYKFENNRVAGDFRDTLDFWTAARKFATPPALNEDFIVADPTHRIFAVTDPAQEKLWCHVFNKVRAVRPMPKFGTPQF